MNGESPPALKPARRGYSLSYKNKTLLSTVDPVAQGERTALRSIRPDRTLYFCPSPLLGYGLDTLLASGGDSAVLCVETDGALLDLSRSSIDRAILEHPRFALTGRKSGAELCRLVREKWGARSFRRLETVKLSGGWQLDGGSYEEAAELLRRDISLDWENAMTLVKLGRRFIANALRNLAAAIRSPPFPAGAFGTGPALVLGAGPSLDPLLDAFQRAGIFDLDRRPFTLICVDTCLAPLRERRIRPDLAVILESQFWNLRDFTGSRNTRIPAALDLSAWPPSGEVLGGPRYFFFTPWTHLRLFDRLGEAGLLPAALPPLGSVGLTAVELARRLGPGPVITGGIDFSFTLDALHARSSPAHLAALAETNRFRSMLNPGAAFRRGGYRAFSKSGGPVRSNPAMRTYRGLFEREFAADRRIRDIAGSGLPLGVETLSVEEAAAMLSAGPPRSAPGFGPGSGPEPKPGPKPGPGNSAVAAAGPDGDGTDGGGQAVAAAFFRREREQLETLRSVLTGSAPAADLERALDEADYLWAHFPDCAGAESRRPPGSDLGFLKRVRAEIDPFIALWRLAEKELV
ncbi:MAG: DUF115 domain-containing protein [Treponema sp.]|jgi:hypothetical protein|nr:DUF115 domain-containing protein [Treponema sp.]